MEAAGGREGGCRAKQNEAANTQLLVSLLSRSITYNLGHLGRLDCIHLNVIDSLVSSR